MCKDTQVTVKARGPLVWLLVHHMDNLIRLIIRIHIFDCDLTFYVIFVKSWLCNLTSVRHWKWKLTKTSINFLKHNWSTIILIYWYISLGGRIWPKPYKVLFYILINFQLEIGNSEDVLTCGTCKETFTEIEVFAEHKMNKCGSQRQKGMVSSLFRAS
jgi:hypothetical protein